MQLDLFTDYENDLPMTENQDNSTNTAQTEDLWSIERLEAIPFFPEGKVYAYIERLYHQHREQGSYLAAKALSSEWVVIWFLVMAKHSKKKKMGRRLLREQPLSEHLNVRLTPREMKVLRDYCWRFDVSASDAVRTSLACMCVIPDWIAPAN